MRWLRDFLSDIRRIREALEAMREILEQFRPSKDPRRKTFWK